MNASPLMIIDSHCHFDFSAFDNSREFLWQQCQKNNISHLVIPGVSPEQWPACAAIAKQCEGIFFAAGLHPWWVGQYVADKNKAGFEGSLGELSTELSDKIAQQLQHSLCVAVGECGLDKAIDAPLDVQLSLFESQLSTAQQLNKPVIVHNRKAHNEILSVLKSHTSLTGVIHAFSGSKELAKQYWDKGFYLGVGGTITYARANKTREAIKRMPIESIILETDAPDMPLCGEQGKNNSPLKVRKIAECLSELRGETFGYIAEKTTENAVKLFSLPR